AALLVLRGRIGWPLATHTRAYLGLAAGGVALALGVTLVLANFTADGLAPPLVYVPLLNPLEIALLAAAVVLWRWTTVVTQVTQVTGEHAPVLQRRAALAAAAAWLFATMMAARAVHHWGGVPFAFDTLALS